LEGSELVEIAFIGGVEISNGNARYLAQLKKIITKRKSIKNCGGVKAN